MKRELQVQLKYKLGYDQTRRLWLNDKRRLYHHHQCDGVVPRRQILEALELVNDTLAKEASEVLLEVSLQTHTDDGVQ